MTFISQSQTPVTNFVKKAGLDLNSELAIDFIEKAKQNQLKHIEKFFASATRHLEATGLPQRSLELKISESVSPFFLQEIFIFLDLFPESMYGYFNPNGKAEFKIPLNKTNYSPEEFEFFSRFICAKIDYEKHNNKQLLTQLREITQDDCNSDDGIDKNQRLAELEELLNKSTGFLNKLQKNLDAVRTHTFGKEFGKLIHPYRLLAAIVATKSVETKNKLKLS